MKRVNKFTTANFLTMLFLTLLISSCDGEDIIIDEPTPSAEIRISAFLILDIPAEIDETNKSITIELPADTDVTALSPTVVVSNKATVRPASNSTQDFSSSVVYTVTAEDGSTSDYTVSVTLLPPVNTNIYTFTYQGKKYEVVRENKTWVNAALMASERGGYLAEINNADENTAVFNEVMNNADITLADTSAPDGGGASYVWLGGNDIAQEGNWIWNGNNDDSSVQFWQGKADGNAVNDLFNNWGTEPDDYLDAQDGLALALTEWPLGSGHLGVASQWNDVNEDNTLYFVIEFDE